MFALLDIYLLRLCYNNYEKGRSKRQLANQMKIKTVFFSINPLYLDDVLPWQTDMYTMLIYSIAVREMDKGISVVLMWAWIFMFAHCIRNLLIPFLNTNVGAIKTMLCFCKTKRDLRQNRKEHFTNFSFCRYCGKYLRQL